MKYATSNDLDQLYIIAQENGIAFIPMADLAGWNMAILLHKLGIPHTSKVAIVCGGERKGAFGLATARHLLNHRWNVSVVIIKEDELLSDSHYFLDIIKKIGAPVASYDNDATLAQKLIHSSHLVIDAILGPNAAKTRSPLVNEVITFVGQSAHKIISFEVPSGLDGSNGISFPPNLKAYATLTLGLPTQAFFSKEGPILSGESFIADVGFPKFVYDALALGSRPKFDTFENFLMSLKDYHD